MFELENAGKVSKAATLCRGLALIWICAAACLAVPVARGTTAPALIQGATMDAGVATSATMAFPSNNTAGNFIAVCVRGGASGETFAVTDSRGNTYRPALLLNVTLDVPVGDTLGIYYAENISGGANAVTVSGSASATIRMGIMEYSGIVNTNSLDATASAQGVSALPNSGNAITSFGGDLILGAILSADPETWSAGTGSSLVQSVPAQPYAKLIDESWVQAAAGRTSANATLHTSDPWGAGIAAFKTAVSPVITSLNPASGSAGATVVIAGSNFGATTGTVRFNGTPAATAAWNSTSITTPVPSGATSGDVVVTAGGATSNGSNFTVVAPPTGVSLVQTTSLDAGTASTAALAFTSSNSVGNWIAVEVRAAGAGQVFTVTDSNGNTYRKAIELSETVEGTSLALYYAENIRGGTNTVNVSDNILGPLRFAIFEYSGIATVNSLDASGGVQGASASLNSGNVTTASSGDLLLGAMSVASFEAFAAGSGYTVIGSVPAPPSTKLMVESEIQPLAGAASAGSTIGATDYWVALLAAFRAATAAPLPSVAVRVSPATASVPTGGSSQAFSAVVQNDSSNQGVTWSLTGVGCTATSCGTLSNATSTSVTYSSPSTLPNPASVTLKATSIASSSASASATITLTAGPVSVTVSPKRAGITVFQTQQFAATLTNDVTKAGVSWMVDGSIGGNSTTGTVSASGLFTPGTQPGAHTVTATSIADRTTSFSATIGVTNLAGVLTYHNDSSRDGSNLQEYALTTSNVTAATFGKLFSCTADGAIYAQPLWISNLSIAGASHNVVFVATEHDSVFAFDADGGSSHSCIQYWTVSLLNDGTPVNPSATGDPGDISGEIGITGTPVIDITTKTLYVVSTTLEGSVYHQRLHGLNLADGTEKFSGPVDITPAITVAGDADTGDSSVGCTSAANTVPFCPLRENQRPGLALNNGTVYVSWASHGDQQPYHGWIMGFTASNLSAAPIVFNDTPNGVEGGIWMAGGAPAIDSSNNVYVMTGNGDWDGATNFGDSILKLSSRLTVSDWFTPSDEANLEANDLDLGSGGATMLVDLPSSSVPHILIGGGKQGSGQPGELFVLNRDNMGQFNSTDSGVVQQFPAGGRIFATGAFWQNSFYIAGLGAPLSVFTVNPLTSLFTTTAVSQSPTTFGFPGVTPSISSSGTTNGIVWGIDSSQYGTSDTSPTRAAGPAILHAYNATNLATELWNSTTGTGNTAGNAVKMTVPTVANGKVYIGTRGNDNTQGSGTTKGELDVYGLMPN
jgi:hypothetical protein